MVDETVYITFAKGTAMKVGLIGGGGVAQTFGKALLDRGHDCVLGIRVVNDKELNKERTYAEPLSSWIRETGGRVVTMTEAAQHGELLINATGGQHSLSALSRCVPDDLKGKILIDIANPLDFSEGFPAFLDKSLSGATSLGEQIQATYPETRVVKAFNTVANAVMVNPSLVPGEHDLFVCGNDEEAKATIMKFAEETFGWKSIVDLGGIEASRATEGLLPFCIRNFIRTENPDFNIKLVS